MIFKRAIAKLRAQDWAAIGIELAIVVVGVALGTWVANWNQERTERREAETMLVQLMPELRSQLELFERMRDYYATTRRYADRALAAWDGSRAVDDNDFVIAAYQASQITGAGTNAENWALTFGGGRLRNIADPDIRRTMEIILTSDYGPIGLNAAATPYREQVRRVIPISVQDAIRERCGDRYPSGTDGFVIAVLPASCDLKIPRDEAARAARALRARSDLAQELNWHLATLAVVRSNLDILERPIRDLHGALARSDSAR